MNQTQPIPKLRSSKQIHKSQSPSCEKLPPVLFSLPDLSETCQTPSHGATYASSLPIHSDEVRELPKVHVSRPQIPDQSPEKTSKLLNAAIGFLAFAMFLIGLKLYTDRASERSRATERLVHGKAQTTLGQTVGQTESKTAVSQSSEPSSQAPVNFNVGPQRATYQAPVSSPSLPPSNHPDESSNKAVLEISDPVVPASYSGETTGATEHSLPSASVVPMSLPPAPRTPAPQPAASLPATTPPVALPTPAPPNASSLNTRDMILLRQGKSVDLSQRDSATKLSGQPYPPVRQKYEPISIAPSAPVVSRPTSMEIPDPPKPYQPIGASFE
jgi:hypothetical protein